MEPAPIDAPDGCDGVDGDGDGRVDEDARSFELGPPVRVRETTDTIATGDCGRCRWARATRLLPTAGGLRAVAMIFDDSFDVPNVFARSLGPSGAPTGAWEQAFTPNVDEWMPRFTPRGSTHGEDGYLVGTVVHAERGAEQLAFGELDARGATRRDLERLDRVLDGRGGPEFLPVEAGALGVFHCSGREDVCVVHHDGARVRYDDPLGATGSELLAGSEALSSPGAATLDGRVGVAVVQQRGEGDVRLLFLWLDPEGALLRERAFELPPQAFRFRPINTVRVRAHDGAFFVSFSRLGAGEEPGEQNGLWFARFAPDGRVLERPRVHDPDRWYYGSATYLRPHPAGGYLLGGLRADVVPGERLEEVSYLSRLDPRGDVQWELTERDGLAGVDDVAVRADGRVLLMINPGLIRGEANPLDVVELRCVPEE